MTESFIAQPVFGGRFASKDGRNLKDDMVANDWKCLDCNSEVVVEGSGWVRILCSKCGFLYYEGLS